MTNHSSKFSLIINNSAILAQYDAPCLDVSYLGMVRQMRNVSWGGPADGSRQWIYQVLTVIC